jgi:hypothetical protein
MKSTKPPEFKQVLASNSSCFKQVVCIPSCFEFVSGFMTSVCGELSGFAILELASRASR